MDVIIIAHNEQETIPLMIQSLDRIKGIQKVLFVLDRCTDDSESLVSKAGIQYVKTKDTLRGRQTCRARNLGVSHTVSTHDVLILDCKRYVVGGVLDFEHWDKDIAILLLENDFRYSTKDYNDVYGTFYNQFFSAGLFFRREALDKLIAYQCGKLFDESLQQTWGVEDIWLGDIAYHLGLSADLYRGGELKGPMTVKKIRSITFYERALRRKELKCKDQHVNDQLTTFV